ncbi:membrane protein [Desulfosporosinus sp. HMP52]|nr:membrane protein [Desulfosporosinus sp. HMP52]
MSLYFMHLIKLSIFLLALIVLVPRAEIRRLAVYGITFGSMYDVIGLTIGHLTDVFRWINFGPFGYGYLPIDSPISWCAFYIMYFYLLPKHRPLVYIFPVSGIVMSMIYSRVLVNLGMFIEPNFLLRLANFTFWFSLATWGYLKLNKYVEAKHRVC